MTHAMINCDIDLIKKSRGMKKHRKKAIRVTIHNQFRLIYWNIFSVFFYLYSLADRAVISVQNVKAGRSTWERGVCWLLG